jgi:hypothetical protein
MAAGIWRFRADLQLAAMPGSAQLAVAVRRRNKRIANKRLAGKPS